MPTAEHTQVGNHADTDTNRTEQEIETWQESVTDA